MDQIKIGKFIADRRKSVNLTQSQLAEKLNITDRAISKWETGKAMPDSSIMLDLCEILKINVNDLLTGEIVTMENYNKELEKNLFEMVKQKEQSDKRLLNLEIIIIFTSIAFLLTLSIVAAYVQMEDWLKIVLVVIGVLPILILMPFLIKIEQTAGYYECKVCGHKYIPTFKAMFFSMHAGRTRYMKCPNCGKKSWQKKVISKD